MKFIPRDPNKHLHWPRGFDDSAFKRPGYLRLSRWTRSRKVPVSCKSWNSMTEDELARSAREMEEEHDSCWYYHHLCCPEKPAEETMISETLWPWKTYLHMTTVNHCLKFYKKTSCIWCEDVVVAAFSLSFCLTSLWNSNELPSKLNDSL